MASVFDQKGFAQRMVDDTLKYQKQYKFYAGKDGKTTYNNEADAFKHAYMQWTLCIENSEFMAKKAGDYHDRKEGDVIGERNMDLWNNAIGREVYKEMKALHGEYFNKNTVHLYKDEAAARIMQKMKRGEMITHPSDKRDYNNMEKERLKSSDRVYYKGEIEAMDEEIRKAHIEPYMNQAIDNYWTIPSQEELDTKVASGDMIYVDAYTKSDGTRVSGYYRRHPIA